LVWCHQLPRERLFMGMFNLAQKDAPRSTSYIFCNSRRAGVCRTISYFSSYYRFNLIQEILCAAKARVHFAQLPECLAHGRSYAEQLDDYPDQQRDH
jgi:hypothetical protein